MLRACVLFQLKTTFEEKCNLFNFQPFKASSFLACLKLKKMLVLLQNDVTSVFK